jgi:hypothetical protein
VELPRSETGRCPAAGLKGPVRYFKTA